MAGLARSSVRVPGLPARRPMARVSCPAVIPRLALAGLLAFGPAAPDVDAFLAHARPEVLVELTPLTRESGQPAIAHIRAAFQRGSFAENSRRS